MIRVINLATAVFWISVPLFAVALALGWSVAVLMWPVLISSAILALGAYQSQTMRKDEKVIYAATLFFVLFGIASQVLP